MLQNALTSIVSSDVILVAFNDSLAYIFPVILKRPRSFLIGFKLKRKSITDLRYCVCIQSKNRARKFWVTHERIQVIRVLRSITETKPAEHREPAVPLILSFFWERSISFVLGSMNGLNTVPKGQGVDAATPPILENAFYTLWMAGCTGCCAAHSKHRSTESDTHFQSCCPALKFRANKPCASLMWSL